MSVKPWDLLNPNSQYATPDLAKSRYEICKACPEFINATKQCKKCGCFMKFKTKLQFAECPIHKWGGEEPVTEKEMESLMTQNDATIFINIPSYKDPEIWTTVDNFLLNAEFPDRVFFGITIQDNDTEFNISESLKRKNVLVDSLEPGTIVGCQPARKNSHKFYNQQDYYLNMDSHMRAIKNWDTELIKEYNYAKQNFDELVFTAYVPPYTVDENGNDEIPEYESNPTFFMSESNVNHFRSTLVPQFTPQYTNPETNVLSPYLSGHFFFTERSVIEAVPFVDEVTFTEEEPLMALRFFTAGYNLVTPKKVFVYHRYGRPDRVLFWDDFPDQFYPRHNQSKSYFQQIIVQNKIDPVNGLFTEKTLEDYENYSGIHFSTGVLEDRVINGLPSGFIPS
jgi:hypothetical protein